jgi:hypothetical protein
MAVSALHNIIFVNQNMNVAASVQTSQFNRFDIQQAAATAILNEKEKVVEETRPPEELHEINPDREHARQEAEEQEKSEEEARRTKPSTPRQEDAGITVDEEGHPHIDIHV